MGAVDSGHIQTLWTLLHLARSKKNLVGEDKLVAMVSPWHHNARRDSDGWAGSTLESIYQSSTSSLYDLATVLGELAKSVEEGGGGFDVVMLTLSQDGKHLKKSDDPNLKREVEFFETLHQKGVRCFLVDNMHHKYVRTPFHLAWGSVNLSKNGLFGHTLDNLTVVREEGEQLYRQHDNIIQGLLNTARPYFDTPVLSSLPDPVPYHVSGDAEDINDDAEAPLDEDIEPEPFAPSRPSDLPPMDQEQSETTNDPKQINLIHANGVIQSLVGSFVNLVRDNRFTSLQDDTLMKKLNPFVGLDEKNDIPNLDVLFQNLNTYIDGSIPEAADRLKESLQLQQEGSWQQWTGRFGRLIHDLRNCYAVISKGDGSPEKTRTRINRARISMRNLRLSR